MPHKGLHGISLAPDPFNKPSSQAHKKPEIQLATDQQLELTRESLEYMVKRYNLAKYRIMREIGEGSKQLHEYFRSGNAVPSKTLEQVAHLFLCTSIEQFCLLPKRPHMPKGLRAHLAERRLVNNHNLVSDKPRPYTTSTRTS